MRDLIERFSYRFQLWQKECYGDRWGADPTAPRNPLRLVAMVAVVWAILGLTEPFVFHRAFDLAGIIDTSIAVVFLGLYQWRSRWAWHLVVTWLLFTPLLYWILRLTGF